jgi:tetratricopeptide (TPR) repeat protein
MNPMLTLFELIPRYDWFRIAKCTPAILCGAFAATLAILCMVDDETIGRYAEEAHRQFVAKDYASARVCLERLAQMQPDQPEVRFGLAMALEAVGKSGRAAAIVRSLAPLDQRGFAPAHLWQAKQELRGTPSVRPDRATAEKHLLFVVRAEPENPEANGLLGDLYYQTGRFALAEPCLRKAARDRPELLFLLANIASSRGKRDEVRAHAGVARTIFRARAERHPDDREARGFWAAAAMLQDDFSGAVEILRAGLARDDGSFYHQALARVYLAHSDALARDPKASLGDRLELLETGLKHNPADPALLDRLVAIIRTGGAEAERGQATLQSLLARGQAPELVHFALGLAAWERHEPAQARLHLEQASRIAPQMPTVANNLAWVLAHSEPPDLSRGLKLIDQAIERWPDQPQCRGTRGSILAKLRRWKEALPDLEAGLRAKPDDNDLHRELATTYENLGEPDMAAEHRRRAGGPPRPASGS